MHQNNKLILHIFLKTYIVRLKSRRTIIKKNKKLKEKFFISLDGQHSLLQCQCNI